VYFFAQEALINQLPLRRRIGLALNATPMSIFTPAKLATTTANIQTSGFSTSSSVDSSVPARDSIGKFDPSFDGFKYRGETSM
jgi:hypothetical protein